MVGTGSLSCASELVTTGLPPVSIRSTELLGRAIGVLSDAVLDTALHFRAPLISQDNAAILQSDSFRGKVRRRAARNAPAPASSFSHVQPYGM